MQHDQNIGLIAIHMIAVKKCFKLPGFFLHFFSVRENNYLPLFYNILSDCHNSYVINSLLNALGDKKTNKKLTFMTRKSD